MASRFDLDDASRGAYLHHRSALGEFFLSSDSVIPTFTRWGIRCRRIRSSALDEGERSVHDHWLHDRRHDGLPGKPGRRQVDHQPGPRVPTGRSQTGSTSRSSAFDGTTWAGRRSRFGETLARYGDFFALFESFRGYVDFFLLQDLVTDDYSAVTFFMPFDDFKTPSVPKDFDTYGEYRRRSIEFIEARNRRIERYAASQ